MSFEDYLSVITDARHHGCAEIQFIGGEATLNRGLADLIRHSHSLGFTFIELYSNLTHIPRGLEFILKGCGVKVATSIYSYRPEVHDRITTKSGSWKRTVENLRRLIQTGIACRASIVQMQENARDFQRTKDFLEELGIESIGVDKVRGFGRGSREADDHRMQSLCGRCAEGVLCVGPDGVVSPCIMSRQWSVGNIHEESFENIVSGARLGTTRAAIRAAVTSMPPCVPDALCGPRQCAPTECNPGINCAPVQCAPVQQCPPNR